MKVHHSIMLLAIGLALVCTAHAAELAAVQEDGSVRVTLDGEVFTAYHYEAADRPFFYPVIAPTGDNITRHWPMTGTNTDEERDHTHHRSLWYTHGAVNGYDFWTEGRGPKIVQTALEVESGKDKVVIACANEWRAKNGKDFAGWKVPANNTWWTVEDGVKALLKPKDWNTMRVKVVGKVYTITLNGSNVLVYDDQTGRAVEEGPIGLQLHAGKVMAIDFRNINLAEVE
jgi:hypothetical protein